MDRSDCPLCAGSGGDVVFAGAQFRVVRTDEGGFPAFYRLVWNRHVAEFSDLGAGERRLCLDGLIAVEEALRAHLRPAKVNLASLGNVVPHLHWHVIARFAWDSHYPAPVWGPPQREAPAAEVARVRSARSLLERHMARQLSTLGAAPAA